jgi:hypothetical protein
MFPVALPPPPNLSQFTMLLNQKTRQLQKEHEVVKQLAAELDRIKVRLMQQQG